MTKKKYIKCSIKKTKLKTVKLKRLSKDSYNELGNLLIATYPGCGHSCTSDIRLKKNIQKLPRALNNVLAMKSVIFNWKDKKRGQKRSIGLIAQDLEKLYPELISENEEGFKQIEYDKLTAILIAAVQELSEKVIKLEKLLHT